MRTTTAKVALTGWYFGLMCLCFWMMASEEGRTAALVVLAARMFTEPMARVWDGGPRDA
jgi:hypothetical protein